MAHSKFWNLYHSESTNRLACWDDDAMELETVVCPVQDGHRRAGRRLTDLSIILPNVPAEDFVWTWYGECLVQDHVLDLLEGQRLNGFDAKPVRAKFKDPTQGQAPKLWELVVTGWAGLASQASGIALKECCDACGYATYAGLRHPEDLVDESQWDGSDFFMVWPLPAFIFITERVAEIIRDARYTGVDIRTVSEVKRTEKYTPGRLSYYMPEPLARKLGEPLGIF